MLSCHEITELSSQYLDKNLPLSKRIRIKIHLLICKKCRRFVAQMTKTIQVLQRFKQMTETTIDIDAQTAKLLEHHRNSKSS